MPPRLTISRRRRLTCGSSLARTEFDHFASLVENYAFSEAYEELMAAGERNELTKKI